MVISGFSRMYAKIFPDVFPRRSIDIGCRLSIHNNTESMLEIFKLRCLQPILFKRLPDSTNPIAPSDASLFVEELLKDNNYLLTTTDGAVNATPCPYCKTGKLVIRQHAANGTQFLGCSHYPSCNQTFKNLEILTDSLICPDCQSGFMVKRNGKFGDFLGCTNYPGCRNTIKLK